MDLDTIARLIGIWGGLLSTVLAVRAFFTSRRRIRVELDLDPKRPVVALTVINIGQRPVTVVGVSITACGAQIPSTETLSAKARADLPAVLTDGQAMVLQLADPLATELKTCRLRADVVVHLADAQKRYRFRARESARPQ